MTFAVWLTGLSGSGKSADRARARAPAARTRREVSVLESDVMRTQLTPSRATTMRTEIFLRHARRGGHFVVENKDLWSSMLPPTARLPRRGAKAHRALRQVFVDTPLEVRGALTRRGFIARQKRCPVFRRRTSLSRPSFVRGAAGTLADAARDRRTAREPRWL
jgi:adenylylsulfate kinase-like enzyme